LVLSFVSAGVSGLDDPGSVDVSQFISMDPPYAYLGGEKDRAVGIGFRSATLDLDGDWTPPALRDKAGVGDDWTGLYLPEVRFFVAPDGLRNLAFECGAQELLIGLGRTTGIWGDFDAALVQQGGGDLRILPRFDADNHTYGVTPAGTANGIMNVTARVPEKSTLIIDVAGGRAPYTRVVKINGTAQTSAVSYDLDLSATGTATVDIVVQSGSPTAAPAHTVITVSRLVEQSTVPVPGQTGSTGDTTASRLNPMGYTFALEQGPGEQVTVRSVPPEPALLWSAPANGSSAAINNAGPGAAYTTTVAAGTDRVFTVQRPGATGATNLDYYFYFDSPGGGGSTSTSTQPAVSKVSQTWSPGAQDPFTAYRDHFDNLAAGSTITIVGDASYENDPGKKGYNTSLAWRRATAVQTMIGNQFPAKNFQFVIHPILADAQAPTVAEQDAWATEVGWVSHLAPNDRTHWRASVSFAANTPAKNGAVTVRRSTAPAVKPPSPAADPPPPDTSPPPSWFRSAKVTVRIVDSQLIALQLDLEIDVNTMTEQKLQGQMGGAPAGTQLPRGRTLDHGTPVGPNNPADGIMAMRVLVQTDPSTGRWTTLLTLGADPADTDGLVHFGWIPQVDPTPSSKDLGVTFLGSYLSFWPMLAVVPPVDAVRNAVEGREGGIVDASLSVAALAVPAVVAALPWFAVERVILFGAEYLHSQLGDGFTGTLLADIEIDWSIDLLGLVTIKREQPLKIRYKAIGLSLTNRDGDDSGTSPNARWDFRPVFDATRGYTIDVASGGGLHIAEPLGQILRILGARLSRSNPMTLEVDIALGIDLGVVAIDQASIRAYLDGSAPPELTALAARIDIPGVLAGAGYARIGNEVDSDGNTIGTIGGQLDLTIRPVSVRVCAAVEIATITEAATGRKTTGVYVGLNVVLPAGIPLGSTGLGIFGFRGIFGMHYQRNTDIGAGTGVPALAWLRAAGGQPHLLRGPDLSGPGSGQILWKPKIDHWAFGVGILIGTMEGGVIINLDGTFLLELPGPRVLIMLNARIVSPPPSVGDIGMTVGILAVIEITPEHFLIGILVTWEVEQLVKIVIPIEAVFPFGSNAKDWHIYLGARPDYGASVEVDVLGIVKGTGYLMFRGNGLNAYNNGHITLPALTGFSIALGVAASFTWGDVDAGLYVRLGGGMDAVLGFEPFTLVGNIWVAGELRLWIVSVGADASLTVIVAENSTGSLDLSVHGQACGHVDFFFFSVSGCVEITISQPDPIAPMPKLVEKVSLQSRSPALAQGTAVDRGVDTSLGQAFDSDTLPGANADLPVVPIDAIPVISMSVPPVAGSGVVVGGLGTPLTTAPGVGADGYAERSSDKYHFEITGIRLERVKGNGQVDSPTLSGGAGAGAAPVVWWTIGSGTEANPAAQLALLTWQASPATKAIEYTDKLVETITDRWGTVCTPAAPPAEVLWTFKLEPLGASATGWDLEGVAWPDPPDTQRSAPPDTTLHVGERWRTGDPQLDALRGVLPAIVIGSSVKCARTHKPPDIMDVLGDLTLKHPIGSPRVVVGGKGPVDDARRSGMLLAADSPVRRFVAPAEHAIDVRVSPVFHDKVEEALSGLEALTDDTIPRHVGDMLQQTALGSAIPSSRWHLALQSIAQGVGNLAPIVGKFGQPTSPTLPPDTGSSRGLCPVKALQAPTLDLGRASNFTDKATLKRLAAAGIKDEKRDLYDIVQIDSGGYKEMGLLLFVPPKIASSKTLVVRSLDGSGSEVGRVTVTANDLLSNGQTLPARWVDLSGPWGNDVEDLVQWSTGTPNEPAFVKVPSSSDPNTIVEIGLTTPLGMGQSTPTDLTHVDPQVAKVGAAPRYYVAAIGLVSAAEVGRSDWDTTQIDQDRQTLTNAVGPASSDHALLVPDSRYRIVVEYFATRQADGATLGSAASPEKQTFWFRTDTIATDPSDATRLVFTDTPDNVPVRLDPWTMMTMPDDNEKGWFGREHLRLVFNTHDVDRLFGAYGKELRLRLEAANGEHPQGTGTTPHPLPITGAAVLPIAATILSPWDQAASDAIDRFDSFCVAVDGTRVQHSEVDFDIPLHPFMEYILDVECVNQGASATARGPRVFRRHFTTGGFGKLEGFAWSVSSTLPSARACAVDTFSTMLSSLGTHPQGDQVDSHLMAHQVEPLGVPDRPQVIVFWQQAGSAVPQPAAILIDATEPMSRSRNYPKDITDTTTPDAPKRWVLEPREWLTLRSGGDAGAVAGIVYAPGNQRAFVVLAPNSRGKHVTVDLVSLGMPDLPFLDNGEHAYRVADATFDHAPWEEVV
jgi:large repetitive protein